MTIHKHFAVPLLALSALQSQPSLDARATPSRRAQHTDWRQASSDRDRRMQWWREARFGMFIHWGIYSVPGGEWNARRDYGEWIMESAKIPASRYEQFATRFRI